MKKIVSISIVSLLSTVIIISSAASQELAVNTNNEEKIFSAPEPRESAAEVCNIANVSKKVLKSFHQSFGEKRGVIWFKANQGFVARFHDQNRSTNVYFASNGAINSWINYYFENELPEDVRHIVKSNFYDYSITHISEVHIKDFVSYLVKIEDKASVKTVRVIGDEYEVVEELTKR